jgi:hypothetical protein
MVDGAGNFPIVLQQTGVVSKVQESVQRGPEAQQAAAAEEAAQQAKERAKSVQKPEESASDNRVRADARNPREQGGGQKKRGAKKQQDDQDQTKTPRPDGGGLVDVVV